LHCVALLLELAALKAQIGQLIIGGPDHSKSLAILKKLILISRLNQFELFFDYRKRVEVTGSQIR
jgi:hypothetical protein